MDRDLCMLLRHRRVTSSDKKITFDPMRFLADELVLIDIVHHIFHLFSQLVNDN